MKKRIGWVIIASVLVLSGCYRHAHSSTRIGDFGYQFDEPKDYCRTYGESPDFEMDCPNGTITVEFVPLGQGDTAESIMTEAIDENLDDCEYSLGELQGINSTITFAELTNDTPEGNACPVFIAVFKFDADYAAYLNGYLGEGVAHRDFYEDFRVVVTTLEPF